MKNKTILITLFFALVTSLTFAQEKRKIGISGTIQESQFGILIPIWLGEKFVLAPAFDFKTAEKIGTDLSIGIVPRFYLKNEKLAPYIGFKIGVLVNVPSSYNTFDNETKIDLLGGIAFGGEYFIADNLSFGVEAQGNFTKSDKNSNRFGNPNGLSFNTGTMISATIYF